MTKKLTLDDFEVGQVWVDDQGWDREIVAIESRSLHDKLVIYSSKLSDLELCTLVEARKWKLQQPYEPSEAEVEAACKTFWEFPTVNEAGDKWHWSSKMKEALKAAAKARGE